MVLRLCWISARLFVSWQVVWWASQHPINYLTDQWSSSRAIGWKSGRSEFLIGCPAAWAVTRLPSKDLPYTRLVLLQLRWYLKCSAKTVASRILWHKTEPRCGTHRPYCLHLSAICGSIFIYFFVWLPIHSRIGLKNGAFLSFFQHYCYVWNNFYQWTKLTVGFGAYIQCEQPSRARSIDPNRKGGGSCCAERTLKIIKKQTVSACLKALQRKCSLRSFLYTKSV